MPVTVHGRRQKKYEATYVTERRIGSNVTIWLMPHEFEALDALAKERGVSKTALVRNLVLDHLAAHRAEP